MNRFFLWITFLFAGSCVSVSMAQLDDRVEVYAQVPYAVGNIAYDFKGELVYSNHPFFAPAIRVMHYNPRTKTSEPFPNSSWNSPQRNTDHYLDDVLGIRNDSKGVVWMLDMGTRSKITPKLVGWNTRLNRLEKIYHIPAPASIPTSQLNDFVIDEKRGLVVIADEDIAHGGDGSKAALVVLNMKTGKSRRLLQGHYSVVPERKPVIVDGKQLNIPGTTKPILVGADGITMDERNEWVYYAPLNGTTLYRVRMDELAYSNMKDIRVEQYAQKRNNGGLSIDTEGNIYLTYVGDKSIGVIPSGNKRSVIYVTDRAMVWPDGVSYNKDGYMYTGAAQLPDAAVFNNGKDLTSKPFLIYRFRPLSRGIWGR